MAGQRLRVEHLVAAQPIVAAEDDRAKLLLRADDAAHGQRALRVEQVAMLPAGLGANPLAGAVAELAGNGPHRRRLELDRKIDDLALVARHLRHLDRGNQPGCDQRAAKIGDLALLIAVAGPEPGDALHVARQKMAARR